MRPLFLHDIETLKREGMLARGERVGLIDGLILKLRITSMWRKNNLPFEFLLGFMQLQHPDGEKVTESQCREHTLMHDTSILHIPDIFINIPTNHPNRILGGDWTSTILPYSCRAQTRKCQFGRHCEWKRHHRWSRNIKEK